MNRPENAGEQGGVGRTLLKLHDLPIKEFTRNVVHGTAVI
jgi:hypothetical protein